MVNTCRNTPKCRIQTTVNFVPAFFRISRTGSVPVRHWFARAVYLRGPLLAVLVTKTQCISVWNQCNEMSKIFNWPVRKTLFCRNFRQGALKTQWNLALLKPPFNEQNMHTQQFVKQACIHLDGKSGDLGLIKYGVGSDQISWSMKMEDGWIFRRIINKKSFWQKGRKEKRILNFSQQNTEFPGGGLRRPLPENVGAPINRRHHTCCGSRFRGMSHWQS